MSNELGEPRSRTFISQGLRLHYADWGNEAAPPLLLIHGGRDHCRNWDWVATRLRQDYHVLALDLRGHGDSDWASDSGYPITGYVYDIAQLIQQKQLAPLTIIGHSLGANLAMRYTGIYPETVRKLVAIEGLGPTRTQLAAIKAGQTVAQRVRHWVDTQHDLAARQPRRYPSVEDAIQRMRQQHERLSAEQIRHLTIHAVRQNEDGTWSWKFDPYAAAREPVDMPLDDIFELWGNITCPTLLMFGADSWAASPEGYRRAEKFRNAEVATVQDATHWVHHNQLDKFMEIVRAFLGDHAG